MDLRIQKNNLEALKHGDEKALESLFYHFAQDLIYFATRLTGIKEEAENIVQDVFLILWENREQLDQNKNIKSYLYTAVRNRCLKQIRHREVEKKYLENVTFNIPSTETPEDNLLYEEQKVLISETVEKLPEKCRTAFTLSRFDNLSYAEIAEVMGISVKTVEVHMGRALKILRTQLKNLLLLFIK